MPPLPPSGRELSDSAGSDGPARRDSRDRGTPRQLVVRPTLRHPRPQDAPIAAQRLTVLVHELANLLDGTLRTLELARQQVGADARSTACPIEGVGPDGHTTIESPKGDIGRRLDVVHAGMSHMVSLLREMSGFSSEARSLLEDEGATREDEPGRAQRAGCGLSRGVPTLAEAVLHAADVLEPVAADLGIRISVQVPPSFQTLAARGLFGVVAGAVRNSIEAIQSERLERECVAQAGENRFADASHERGSIEITGGTMNHETRAWIEIADDGIGFSTASGREADRCFEIGYTTKAGSSGIGLAVAKDTVSRFGGTITLGPRAQATGGSRGAVLRVEWPIEHAADAGGER